MIKDILKDPLTWCIALLVLFVVVIPGVGIHYAGKRLASFEEQCTQAGGKVITLRRDSLCTSPDGRIIGDM